MTLFASIFHSSLSAQDTTSPGTLKLTITGPNFISSGLEKLPKFPPRCNKFIEPELKEAGYDYTKVDECAHFAWVPTMECPNDNQVKRGEILMNMAKKIIYAHNYTHSTEGVKGGYKYEPRVLVCKMFKESTFRPQVEAYGEDSSAAGLSQITKATCIALMSGFHGEKLLFRSEIPEYSHIDNGEDLYNALSGSIALQIEVGLAVLQLKNLEGTARKGVVVSGVRQLLELYYASSNQKANKKYAQDIINCSTCVEKNNNKISYSCLLMAQGGDGSCP
jgi:hypothetical protein